MEFLPIRPARHEPVAPRETARPSHDLTFDVEYDVVIVGGGPGGLAAAVFSRWLGAQVLLLEKAPETGGTGVKAAFNCWAPDNRWLHEAGLEDPEEDYLRFVARTSRPERYDPDSPTLGQSEWEYAGYKAIYESAKVALQELHDSGVLRFRFEPEHGEYWPNLDENVFKRGGRGVYPEDINETGTNGGPVAMDALAKGAEEAGADIRTGHRVQRLIMDGERVAGVVATTADGETLRAGASRGVLFATGGFTHDRELTDNFLARPVWGGGATRTNEGDFVRIAPSAGAQLRNMQYAWGGPLNLGKVLNEDPALQCTFLRAGDSMICVNPRGERVLNEKLPYNEFVARMFDWDASTCEYPNRVLIQIWDEHTQEHSVTPNDFMGSAVLPADQRGDLVLVGSTLKELRDAIAVRLDEWTAHTGNAHLSSDFLETLHAAIERFNGFARTGVDADFHRGGRAVEHTMFGGFLADEPDKPNPLMYPIAAEGPYYATLLVPGTLDTKGGPKVDADGRVVDDRDRPIPGLYGVGNCVASFSASAYWAAGGTLGPIFGFAHRAAAAMSADGATRPVAAQATEQTPA